MIILDLGRSLLPVQTDGEASGAPLFLLSPEEFLSPPPCIPPGLPPYAAQGRIRFCKAEPHAGFLLGTVCVPPKGGKGRELCFAFYLFPQQLVLVAEPDCINALLRQLSQEGEPLRSPALFLRDLMDLLLDSDLQHLESLEENLERLEEDALENTPEDFSHRMLPLKKEISRFYRYYSQLLNLCGQLAENLPAGAEGQPFFSALTSRISLLREETVTLREYSLQIREVYQAQTDIRQNNIVKFLTIVTTIFFPLSVIAGWYGMNFSDMPELRWKYGYPLVAALSLLIVLLCVWLFKKRKFW